METLQPCSSFKVRRIGHACNKYVPEGAKVIVKGKNWDVE
jgi:hypothetical protein